MIKGTTPSSSTGPTGDFSGGGNSYYIYAEASSPATSGMKAILQSKEFKAGSVNTLRFHYHMYGIRMGKLNVYKEKHGRSPTMLMRKSGNQGNMWEEYKLTISSDLPYKIMFEAVRGRDFDSDIALDSISFQGK